MLTFDVKRKINTLRDILEHLCNQSLIKHHACRRQILYSFLGGAFWNVPNQNIVDNVLNSSEIRLA